MAGGAWSGPGTTPAVLLDPLSGREHLGGEFAELPRIGEVLALRVELHDRDELAGSVDVLVSTGPEVGAEGRAAVLPCLPIGPLLEVVDVDRLVPSGAAASVHQSGHGGRGAFGWRSVIMLLMDLIPFPEWLLGQGLVRCLTHQARPSSCRGVGFADRLEAPSVLTRCYATTGDRVRRARTPGLGSTTN